MTDEWGSSQSVAPVEHSVKHEHATAATARCVPEWLHAKAQLCGLNATWLWQDDVADGLDRVVAIGDPCIIP